MKVIKKCIIYSILTLVTTLQGCVKDEEFGDSAIGNFDALWNILNNRYCFFEYKDVDWNEVYSRYRPQVTENMNSHELFALMADMLAELKDGHVNLTSNFDQARYWKWFEDYPDNFNADIVDKNYLQEPHYKIAGGMRYRILENENIGYIYYGSFSSYIGENSLDEILYSFSNCKGIIIDVRNNGGGSLNMVDRLVARFIDKDLTAGYIRHKLSPEHNHFSEYYPISITPANENRIKYFGKVAVLTNRMCYSATNQFVSAMKQLPNVAIIGDKTGGGSGVPFSSVLPNGWSVRFSSSPIVNSQKEEIEFGIEPTIKAEMGNYSTTSTSDNIIDTAINWINNQ